IDLGASPDGGVAGFDGGMSPQIIVSNAAIQAELARLIHAGLLPAEDGNNLYFVHLPARVQVVDPLMGTSCTDYGAFHDSFDLDGHPTFYALMPECGGECAGASCDLFEGLTTSASHELIEAVTDPNVGTWGTEGTSNNHALAWDDDNN